MEQEVATGKTGKGSLTEAFKTSRGAELYALVHNLTTSFPPIPGTILEDLDESDYINIMKDNAQHMATTTEQLMFWFK